MNLHAWRVYLASLAGTLRVCMWQLVRRVRGETRTRQIQNSREFASFSPVATVPMHSRRYVPIILIIMPGVTCSVSKVIGIGTILVDGSYIQRKLFRTHKVEMQEDKVGMQKDQ